MKKNILIIVLLALFNSFCSKPAQDNNVTFIPAGSNSTLPVLTAVTIASNNPNPAMAKAGDTITVTITSSESITPPAVTIAGVVGAVTGSLSSYSASITVTSSDTEGAVALSISGYNGLAGNAGVLVTTTTNSSSVRIDRTAPTVSINALPAINMSNAVTYSVSGICSENGQPVNVNVGGAISATTCNSGVYSVSRNVNGVTDNASVPITVNHNDAAGNTATPATASVLKDTVVPTVTITAPATITGATMTVYTVSGSCSENGRDVNISVGGVLSTSTCSAGAYATAGMNVSGLADGSVSITADHTDLAGNAASQASASATKNTNIPSVTINSPASINAANIGAYTVSGNCSENGQIVNVNVGGVAAAPTCALLAYTTAGMNVSGLADGSVTITADHSNAALTAAPQASATVLKDVIAPTVTIAAPTIINVANKTAYTVSGNCSENTRIVTVNVGGVTAAPVCSVGSYLTSAMNVSGLADNAAVSITANHTDSVGNPATQASTTVIKDTVIPTVTITSALVITNSNKAGYSVSGACSENGRIVTVNVGGVAASPTCTSLLYTASAMNVSALLDSASVSVTANLSDAAGNAATQASITVIKDTIATVSITTAAVINNANKAGYSISGACSDNGSLVTVSVGGVIATPTCASQLYTTSAMNVSALADGAALSVTANHSDSVGNTAPQASTTVLKDTVAPTVTITSPAAINNPNKASYSVSGTCSDNGNLVTVSVGAVIATPTCTSLLYTTSLNVSTLVDSASVNVTANHTDAAGNPAIQASATVVKDTVNPTVTITSAPVINNTNKASYVVSGACSENGRIVTVSVGGVAASPTCTSLLYTASAMNVSGVADGAVVSVTANHSDAAGNPATQASTTVIKDTVIPTVTITSALVITNSNKAGYSVSGACSENGRIVTVNVGGVAASPTCTTLAYTASAMNVSGVADSLSVSVTANHTDAAGNAATQASTTVIKDTIAPTIVSAETLDTTNNGKIDTYKITFSENVVDATFPGYVLNGIGSAQTAWLVNGYTGAVLVHGTAAPVADTVNDNILYLKFTEGSLPDTGAKPDLTTTATPGITDSVGYALAQIFTATLVETDKALPIVISATGKSQTTLQLLFSEDVTKATAEVASSYTVTGLTVNAASIGLDPVLTGSSTVSLTTTAQANTTSYTVTAANGLVTDYNANGAATGTNSAAFTSGTFARTITVSISGLTGTLVLQETISQQNLSISANGASSFSQFVDPSPYYVVAKTQPAGQHCSIAGVKGGTLTGTNPGLTITCRAANTTMASRVYGQLGNFTSNYGQDTGLNNPTSVKVDSAGGLYVADNTNNRVLHYPSGSTTADRVYGQLGSFTTYTVNTGGISANSLSSPNVTAVDSAGGLYVADSGNNRVLHYPSGSTTADRVYGQSGFTLNGAGAASSTAMNSPYGLAVDSAGGLYVSDSVWNRILHFPSGSTTADRVYGQGGSFTTSTASTNANGLYSPRGIALDSSGGLYVAENMNNRVLHYPLNSTTADRVYGQAGLFTSSISNNGGISANSLQRPYDVAVDSAGGLYVADTFNNRVLHYLSGSTTANVVYGQNGNFTTGNWAINANALSSPRGLAVDSTGGLYVADLGNIRLLYFLSGSTLPSRVYGQGGVYTTATINNGGVTANSLYAPFSAAVDSLSGLYVTDTFNNRVLHYLSGSTTANVVYGQGGILTTATINNGGVSANSLYAPLGAAVDSASGLYVADWGNNRVLHYVSGSTTANVVYGQGGSFTTNTATISATGLGGPRAVAVDSAGGLYVADTNNHRVLHYPSGLTTADRVYGQGGIFTTGTANNGGISAGSLNLPYGVAVDPYGGLYIADWGNHRVLHYLPGSITADKVYGQLGSFVTNTANNGGISANSLLNPSGIMLDSAGELYVVDGNNRVLHYSPGSTTADKVYGQLGSFSVSTANNGGITANSLFYSGGNANYFSGIAIDASDYLYIVDANNNRVLFY